VDATDVAHDVDEPVSGRALGQGAAGKPTRANVVPRNGDQLEESFAVHKLPARKPREGSALEDLKMHGSWIVFLMILPVFRDPGANVVLAA
jgi:hypothetical protein